MSDHIKTDLAECLRIEAALTTDPHTRTRLQAYIAEAEKLSRTPQPVTPAGGEGYKVPDGYRLQPLWEFDAMCAQAVHPPVADAALVRDAERYRWLRRSWQMMKTHDAELFQTLLHISQSETTDQFDAAIDSALNQRGGGDHG